MQALPKSFFKQPTTDVAKGLLGQILCRRYQGLWLKARIVETEAYCMDEKASHASLGLTPSRKAMFMPAGTIYMYYSRGNDSMNISCEGDGNAVLIKAAFPWVSEQSKAYQLMQQLNPLPSGDERPFHRLLAGQTLLCKALNLKVRDWDQQTFNQSFFIAKGETPKKIIATTRLGIPEGRDAHLPYRFIEEAYVHACTQKPKVIFDSAINY